MRFALSDRRESLFSLGVRLKKEGHQVNKGSMTTNGTLLISDHPLDPARCNGEGIGVSSFALLMAKSKDYQETIKIAAGLHTTKEVDYKYSIGCWFNGTDFVYPIFGIVDDAYFMERDRGYPCLMGSTVRAFKEPPKIFMDTLWKLKTCLRSVNFRGFILVDCIEDNVVNIYPHFRADSIYAILEFMQEELGRTLIEIFNGGKKSIRCCRSEYSIAIRISVPPYPYSKLPFESFNKNVKGYCDDNAKHIWFREVNKDEKGKWKIAGGIIGTVTARGDTVKECRRRAYRTISNLEIEWLQYRQDIGMKAANILPSLSTAR